MLMKTSSNLRNQATIPDGKVIVQQVQGRQTLSYAGTGNKGITTTLKGNYVGGQIRVAKCYNYQGEEHMARQCTQQKRPRNAAWYKEKLMLVEAQETGQILDEEELAFLADPEISEAIDVQEIQYIEQIHINDFQDNEIHSDTNIILYFQYLQESQDVVIQDTNSSAPNDLLVLSLVEQMTDHETVLEKQNKELYNIICKMYRSTQAMHMLTKPQVFYNDTHKQALGYQNPFHLKKAQWIQPRFYDGSVIAIEHVVISMFDDEETLILEDESRSKMLDKQNDPISTEKKIKISPIDYLKLNKIKEDFGKRFVTKKELSPEQAFLLKHSSFFETPVKSHTPVELKLLVNFLSSVTRKGHGHKKLKDLNAQLQEKVFAITKLKNELRKLKGKNVVDTAVSKPNATIAPGMFKLDIELISHRHKNNKDAHEVYIEKTIENTHTLHGFVERARTQNPSEPLLESPYMFTKHVQELLVYVSQTCPNSPKPSEKLVVVTSMNKDKRVRLVKLVTSSSNIPKQTDSLKTKDSNKPLLTSTRVKPTTSASGSKPSGNTKNNRIT
nr:hypothetical protein [Tanacetum cinerariifolium]